MVTGTELAGYGTGVKSGKCDYWVNCGYPEDQQPCTNGGKTTTDLFSAVIKLNDSDLVPMLAQQACRLHQPVFCTILTSQQPVTLVQVLPTVSMLGQGKIFSEDILRCFDSDPYGEIFILDNPCEERTDYYVHIPRENGMYPFCASQSKKSIKKKAK